MSAERSIISPYFSFHEVRMTRKTLGFVISYHNSVGWDEKRTIDVLFFMLIHFQYGSCNFLNIRNIQIIINPH